MEKIIFDTDLGGDSDDAGTLGLLHRLCDAGEAELLAVTHSKNGPYYAGAIDAINRYHGRVVPVGINYPRPAKYRTIYAEALCKSFENSYPPEDYENKKGAPDTLDVLRRTLADAADQSVTIVVTGTLSSIARLIRSQGDEISPLSGVELVTKKVKRTVAMGGRFFESWPMVVFPDGQTYGTPVMWEWNIRDGELQDARDVCALWPTELLFSSYEIGSYIVTMDGYPNRAPKDDPVAMAYQIQIGGKGRCSWDQTAMLEAIRPGAYWNYHEFGRIWVDDDFVTHWKAEKGGRQSYLLPKVDYTEIARVIDEMMERQPITRK